MLWNWNTIDACFISSGWHIRSHGMFAGSIVAIVCLALVLEALKRAQRELDRRFLAREFGLQQQRCRLPISSSSSSSTTAPIDTLEHSEIREVPREGVADDTRAHGTDVKRRHVAWKERVCSNFFADVKRTLPPWWLQVIRAALHTSQFAVGYFLMLLAMYYNGYVIISIFTAVFLGNLWVGRDTYGALHLTHSACCCVA